jgi:hypothetical protein
MADTGEVGAFGGGEDARGAEPALGDQVGDRRPEDERVEGAAAGGTEATAIEPLGGGGDAEQLRLRIRGGDARPLAGDGVVGLVHYDQVGRGEAGVTEAAGEGLHRRDLHGIVRGGLAGGD